MAREELEDELFAALTAKVMVLENAVALTLAAVLDRHPDPLGALAALEQNLDHLVTDMDTERTRRYGHALVGRLIQACQLSLDEIEGDRAKRRSSQGSTDS